MERNVAKVLGYNVDLLSMNEAINYVSERIKEAKKGQIITINPEIIELANKNQKYADILRNAELIIPDGTGIKIALKFKGINQERVPGVDFSAKMLEICAKNNYPIAIIGSKEEIIQLTKTNIQEKYDGLKICYFRNGYFTPEEENDIINDLAEARPKFVLVALGAPKQEIFIQKCLTKIQDAMFIGVGGTFDVWSGKIKRAPLIFRKTGFEWLYRISIEPQRIKRIYKTLPLFLFKVIIEAIKEKNMCKREINDKSNF